MKEDMAKERSLLVNKIEGLVQMFEHENKMALSEDKN